MTGKEIRQKRVTAGIAGSLVCARAGVDRSRYSLIEREYVRAPEAELARIASALEELLAAKQQLIEFAATIGWPVEAL
jgi:transcriptional regulator with XRE-family HTH domain